MWIQTHKEFKLGPDSESVLLVACLNLTRYLDVQERLNMEGRTFKSKTGQIKKHPLCEVEKYCAGHFLAAIRLLDLEYPELKPKRPGRPPGSRTEEHYDI